MYHCECGAEIDDPSGCGMCGRDFEDEPDETEVKDCPDCGDPMEDEGTENEIWTCPICEETTEPEACASCYNQHFASTLKLDRMKVMQPIEMVNGVARFRVNEIVRFLLDAGPFDLHKLALMPFSREDHEQLAQLIGYSVSGFGDLSYTDPKTVAAADAEVERLSKEKQNDD